MAASAVALRRDPARRRRFGRAARRQAVVRFAEAAIVERYRELFRRVVGGG
jgi:hypothetical protein